MITAKAVHELQANLDHAEQTLSVLRHNIGVENRGYAPLGSSEWEHIESHPDIRHQKALIEVLTARVEQAQVEVGGVVFRIPTWRIPDLQKKIAKIERRAAKLNVEPPRLTVTEETETEERLVERATGHWVADTPANREDPRFTVQVREWTFVAVAGEPPHLAGWAFIATLQHDEAGTIIRRIPGIRAMVKNLIQTPDEKHASEEMERRFNLDQYREAGPVCDHCHTRRARKDTYIVVKLETGEFKQVGSNCLADFLGGLSPQAAAKGFEYISTILDDVGGLEDEERGFSGYRSDPMESTLEFLTHAALMVRKHGWHSRSQDYHTPTANLASQNLFNLHGREKDRHTGQPLWTDPEEEDIETAKAALEYIRSDEFGGENPSDFEHNLKVATAGEYTKDRNFGIVAAGILVYSRHIEREIKRQVEEERKAEATNEHVGQIKERLELTLTVTKIFPYSRGDSYDGYEERVTYITTLVDPKGRTFKWFGSYPLNEGSSYEGRWTVKAHEEYQGTKETVITRPKIEELAATA